MHRSCIQKVDVLPRVECNCEPELTRERKRNVKPLHKLFQGYTVIYALINMLDTSKKKKKELQRRIQGFGTEIFSRLL